MKSIEDNYSGGETPAGVVDTRVVDAFHRKDDLDVAKDSHHHTIGVGSSQAASGNHSHRGVDSVQLLAGVTLTGAKAGNAALASVCAALVELGATDNTTA
jgi:hypothetical protein